MPDFAEWFRGCVGTLAYHAAKAHAGDIRFAFGHDFDHFGIESDNVRLLWRVAASVQLGGNLGIETGRHEIAHGRQIAFVISRLQSREIKFCVLRELLDIEAWRVT